VYFPTGSITVQSPASSEYLALSVAFSASAMKQATRYAKGDTFEAFPASVHECAANRPAQGYRRVVSLVISFW
jgi:hypothetical protein